MGGMRQHGLVLGAALALVCGAATLISCTAGVTPLLTQLKQSSVSPVSNFTATVVGASEIDLSWTLPSTNVPDGIYITRKVGSYPANQSDGQLCRVLS